MSLKAVIRVNNDADGRERGGGDDDDDDEETIKGSTVKESKTIKIII